MGSNKLYIYILSSEIKVGHKILFKKLNNLKIKIKNKKLKNIIFFFEGAEHCKPPLASTNAYKRLRWSSTTEFEMRTGIGDDVDAYALARLYM